MTTQQHHKTAFIRPGNHLAVAVLGASLAGILLVSGEAQAKGSYGRNVDSFCRDLNGTEPYDDEGCDLCHSNDYEEHISPAWDWYFDNEWDNFCGAVAVNTAPVLDAIGNQTAQQGSALGFAISASDADGNALTLSASGLPSGASFDDNGNGSGQFNWTPSAQQSGNFPVTFTATDNGSPVASDAEDITISVGIPNRPPVLAGIGNLDGSIASAISLTINATDPDNDGLVVSAANLPIGATFSDNLDGSGSFNWTPAADQAGNHNVLFSVVDNGIPQGSDSEEITINIAGGNSAPALASIGNQTAAVGQLLEINFSASDADSDPLSYTASGLPTGALLKDNGDGSAQLSWTPDASQTGQHDITIDVQDDQSPALGDNETFAITVGGGNQPPVLAAIGSHAVDSGSLLEVSLSASDPEGDALQFSATGLPTGAELVDNNDGTALLRWTPASDQSGSFDVTVTVSDNASTPASDAETLTLSINGSTTPGTGAATGTGTGTETPAVTNITWGAAGSPWALLSLSLFGLISRLRRRG